MRHAVLLELCLLAASVPDDYTVASNLPPAYAVRSNLPARAPAPKAGAATPRGYPPAPAGYRWAQYPGGIWGLVQDGCAVPAAPPALLPAPVARPYCPPGQT